MMEVDPQSIHVDVEMPWTAQEEQFLKSKMESCRAVAKVHTDKCAGKKFKYYTLALPMILVPFVSAATTNHIDPEDAAIMSTVSLTVTGVLNSISQLFNFGKQYRMHEEFAGKYDELAGYIENELMKPARFRVQLDVFLERVNQKISALNETAPAVS